MPDIDWTYMPDADALIDAAEELRALSDAYSIDTEGPCRLLEQVAIALLPPGGQRDVLLEGRTDLGEPEVPGVPALPPACVRVRRLGGEMDLSYDEWARDFIQDEDEAITIASRMLYAGGRAYNPYPFNTSDTGAAPEDYCEFEVIDRNELLRQRANAVNRQIPS